MSLNYFSRVVRLLTYLASLMGFSSLTASVVYFVFHRQPTESTFVAWALVAVCALLVLIIGAVWFSAYLSWRRAISEEEYYWKIHNHSGV